ncbi:dachshund homolog 2 isoform X3 [Neocloeon triangulifer]|uniref:dachshund homolog 2 isoform X3 n=1 Tax=Neocloeon triangulifer TaxID=2078957 RepID=UPI00286F75AC|nr:dachshund homolog 2 isoform X3 [Neocloeon triangulifer]
MSMDSVMDSSSSDRSSPSPRKQMSSPPVVAPQPPPAASPSPMHMPPPGHRSPASGNSPLGSPIATPTSLGLMGRPPPLGHPSLLMSAMGSLAGLPAELSHHHAAAAAAAALERASYNSPPPIASNDPTANECKLVEYRGQKVAAFIISGETMLCLPQAFELFLKHLVGGLHTVYTKLKRLDIVPLVCNVEQVRILRGLGAIQPGVNRCKLLCCKDFDVLYRDCTTARTPSSHTYRAGASLMMDSSRPGRPPKRASVGLSIAASQMGHHALKKHRLENGSDYSYENGHLGADYPSRLEKSPLLANGYNHPPTHLNPMQFMQLNHHPAAAHTAILSPAGIPLPSSHGLSRADGSIIKNQPSGIPGIDAIARSGIWENCRAAYEDIVKHLERLRDERGDAERVLALNHKAQDLSSSSRNANGGRIMGQFCATGSPAGQSPVLNLSKSGGGGGSAGEQSGSEAGGHTGPEDDDDDDNVSDVDEEDEKEHDLSDAAELNASVAGSDHGGRAAPGGLSHQQAAALNYSTLVGAAAAAAGGVVDPSGNISSTETLLRNIQGLLKVAADNARQQERQINYEKAELKMDVIRERELKESLERQLMDEQKIRVLYQKRLKKERKARRRLQDQLELEMKRRSQYEDALKNSAAGDALRLINEANEQQSSARETQRESPPAASGATSAPGAAPTSSAPSRHCEPPSGVDKQWNYPSGLDLVAGGAAFWQNYSESLAQELEMERKNRQQQNAAQQQDRDVKSPLQESRAGYYKNSVLFSSAT